MKVTANQNGFSLIEVLVTVLILATSLLAVATLQTRSLEYNHSAYLRSQANIIAYDILDRMRLDPANNVCAVNEVEDDILEELVANLPEGKATVGCNACICKVDVTWGEQNGLNEGGEKSTFSYTTRL